MLHDIRNERGNPTTFFDSFVLGNDEEAIQVSVVTNITVKNAGSLKLSDKPFSVLYNIADNKVESQVFADWGKKVPRARQEQEPPAQPNIMQTVAQVQQEPPREDECIPEVLDQPSTSSGITGEARELPRVTENIKLRKNSKQISVVLQKLMDDQIAQGQGRPKRGHGPVYYKDTSSEENSDDERLRFKSAKTRKFWRRERKRMQSWGSKVSDSDHSESTVATRQSRPRR